MAMASFLSPTNVFKACASRRKGGEGRGGGRDPEEGRGGEGDNAERGLMVGRWELDAGDKGGHVMIV